MYSQSPVAYLGGAWCDAPPLARPWKFFTGDFIWNGAFLPFSSKFQKKMGKFAASIERSKAKSVSALGGFAPWPPDQGLCPWTPLGAPPSDPRYRLTLCALAMPPLCQILNTPLSVSMLSSAIDSDWDCKRVITGTTTTEREELQSVLHRSRAARWSAQHNSSTCNYY